jgi:hypothetical protein
MLSDAAANLWHLAWQPLLTLARSVDTINDRSGGEFD